MLHYIIFSLSHYHVQDVLFDPFTPHISLYFHFQFKRNVKNLIIQENWLVVIFLFLIFNFLSWLIFFWACRYNENKNFFSHELMGNWKKKITKIRYPDFIWVQNVILFLNKTSNLSYFYSTRLKFNYIFYFFIFFDKLKYLNESEICLYFFFCSRFCLKNSQVGQIQTE